MLGFSRYSQTRKNGAAADEDNNGIHLETRSAATLADVQFSYDTASLSEELADIAEKSKEDIAALLLTYAQNLDDRNQLYPDARDRNYKIWQDRLKECDKVAQDYQEAISEKMQIVRTKFNNDNDLESTLSTLNTVRADSYKIIDQYAAAPSFSFEMAGRKLEKEIHIILMWSHPLNIMMSKTAQAAFDITSLTKILQHYVLQHYAKDSTFPLAHFGSNDTVMRYYCRLTQTLMAHWARPYDRNVNLLPLEQRISPALFELDIEKDKEAIQAVIAQIKWDQANIWQLTESSLFLLPLDRILPQAKIEKFEEESANNSNHNNNSSNSTHHNNDDIMSAALASTKKFFANMGLS